VKQHAGYFNVTTATKRYFYWFFESRSSPSADPLMLWMTGQVPLLHLCSYDMYELIRNLQAGPDAAAASPCSMRTDRATC